MRSIRRTLAALVLPVALLSAVPSVQACPYAWSDLTLECVLEIPPAALATGCPAAGATCVATCVAASAPCPAPSPESGERAWCVGPANGGPGVPAEGLSLHPDFIATLPAFAALAPIPTSERLGPHAPLARGPTRASFRRPPIRAPPAAPSSS